MTNGSVARVIGSEERLVFRHNYPANAASHGERTRGLVVPRRHSDTPSSHLRECYEASTEFTMVVAKWHVRRTSGAPKALAVALSFCRLLGLGRPKQAFAKIVTPRSYKLLISNL
jgi:hypothetical protein